MKDATYTFDQCGGHLALDFANTVSDRHTDAPIERLTSYERLLEFAEQTELLSARDATRLRAWAKREPRAAAEIVAGAVVFREASYRIFAETAREHDASPADLEVLNDRIARTRLGPSLEWEWAAGKDAPDAFLLPIVRRTVELLTAAEKDRVKICDAHDCVWLFYDSSKNRSRRWCDMKQCGNRVKARRFYDRNTRA